MPIESAEAPVPLHQFRRLVRENKRLRYELGVANSHVPHLRHMIESCPDGLALLSDDGVVLEHNGAMVGIFERTEDLLIDQTFSALVGSSMRDPADPNARSPFSVEHLSRAIASPQTLLVALRRFVVEFRLSGWVEEERAYFVVSARTMETSDQREREQASRRGPS